MGFLSGNMNFLNIYMFMAAAILLLAVCMKGNVPQNKQYIIWSCLIMFVVYGLRDTYSLGGDACSSYLHHFQQLENTSWSAIWQNKSLFKNFLWILSGKVSYVLFDGDYQLFVSLISAFVMLVFGWFIYRYSVNPVQSFIFYWGLWFFTFNFSALKQSVAMSFILLAFDALMNRKLIRYLLAVVVAALFHFPAFVFLPAYWLVKLNPRVYLLFLVAGFAAVYLWRDQIVRFIAQFYYEDRVFEGEERFLTGKVIVMLALVLISYIRRPPSKEEPLYSASLQFVAIATVIQLFSVYNNVFERLADYYFQFSVIFVPFFFKARNEERLELIKTDLLKIGGLALDFFCMLRFNDAVTRTTSMLLPYQFFFQSNRGEALKALVSKLFM